MADTYEKLFGIYRDQYAAASNKFHPLDAASAIAAALDKLGALAAQADQLIAAKGSSAYPTASSFKAAADSQTVVLLAQLGPLKGAVEGAKSADATKIKLAAAIDQVGLSKDAQAQQAADATLIGNAGKLVQSIEAGFAAALASYDGKPPPTPPPDPALEAFKADMVDFFLRAWPKESAERGGATGLPKLVDDGTAAALSYGIAEEDDLRRFLLLALLLGPGFDKQSWAQVILTNAKLGPDEKVAQLEDASAKQLPDTAVTAI